MNVQPIQKAILAGLTGVGSFVFAYNLSKTWNVQGLVGGTKRDADTDLKRYEKGNLGELNVDRRTESSSDKTGKGE